MCPFAFCFLNHFYFTVVVYYLWAFSTFSMWNLPQSWTHAKWLSVKRLWDFHCGPRRSNCYKTCSLLPHLYPINYLKLDKNIQTVFSEIGQQVAQDCDHKAWFQENESCRYTGFLSVGGFWTIALWEELNQNLQSCWIDETELGIQVYLSDRNLWSRVLLRKGGEG